MANQMLFIRRARVATSLAFFIDGLAFSSWVTRIPAVQEKLHLSNATLGFALLMTSIGALITMPIVGRLIAWSSSKTVLLIVLSAFGMSLILPALATGRIFLGIALFVFGCGFGAVNIAANAQAVTVERQYGSPIMGSFHATFSLGGIVGAILGSAASAVALSALAHFILIALTVVIAVALLGRFLLHDEKTAKDDVVLTNNTTAGLLLLGTIAFCSMFGEGAMADWSAVFLRQVSHTSVAVAALGFGAFSFAMTTGRLVADRVTLRIGPVRLVRLGGLLAASGLMLAMLFPGTITAITGFTLVGAGLSSLVPTLFSAAGRTPGVAASVAIATVSTTGYFGFLFGPPLIGVASEVVTLRWAMLFVFTAACVAVALARHVNTTGGSSTDMTDIAVSSLSPSFPCSEPIGL